MGQITNFPQGFAAGLNVRGMPLLQMNPGNTYWVSNNPQLPTNAQQNKDAIIGSDGNRGTFQRPFATLLYALQQCNHNTGDIIFIKPGHVETLSNATALIMATAGVSVIGLGSGTSRPTFIMDTATTANIPVRAANMAIQNCLFLANFAAIASVFTSQTASVTASIAVNNSIIPGTGIMTVTVVGSGTLYPGASLLGTAILPQTIILSQLTGTTGGIGTYLVTGSQTFASGTITSATPDFAIDTCEFRDLSTVLNFVSIYTASAQANGSDGLSVTNNTIKGLGTTAATTALKTTVNQDRWNVSDNYGNWAVLNDTAAMIAAGAASITQFKFNRNFINRPNTSTTSGLAISTSGTAWTGQCNDNRIFGLNGTAQIWINTGTKLGFNQNFCPITAAADKSGLINPAAV